jgi:LysM repeat protein
VPRAYQPPLSRRPQAVQSASPRGRRGLLLLPLLGLIPLAAAVLASDLPGVLLQPRSAGPVATITVVAANATAQGKPTLQAIAAPPVATSAPTAISAPAAAAPTPVSSASASSANASSAAAPAAPTPGPSTQTSAPFRAYRVQPGDTVKFVAEMYGVSSASIAQASGLPNADHLTVGQVLTIPAQPGWLYRVQAGETLDQIAARTGVSSDAIATVSHLSVATVRAGDVLLIPDLAAAKSK